MMRTRLLPPAFFLFALCDEVFFSFVHRNRNLRLLSSKITRRLGRVYLFTTIDYIGLRPGYRRVG